jgi:hypothetical protein
MDNVWRSLHDARLKFIDWPVEPTSERAMALCPYSADELVDIQRVLDEIIAEAKQLSPGIDAEEIIERLFDLADHGERDPNKLRAAVLRLAA